MPKITIVTVTFNAQRYIERTINSVQEQDYKNIEYIIIDGASTDDTIKKIKNKNVKLNLISEKDNGIYDAMNKGIINATGDWIFFLNAGDIFYSKNTISTLVKELNQKIDILYGDIVLVDEAMQNKQYLMASGIENASIQPPFWHQGMLIKISLHINRLYDLRYKSCSDYDFMMYCVTNNFICKYINLPFAYYLEGGESTTNIYKNRLEGIAIASKYIDIDLLPTNFFFSDFIENHAEKCNLNINILRNKFGKNIRNLEVLLKEIKNKYNKIAIYGCGTITNLIAPYLGNQLIIIADKNHQTINTKLPLCAPKKLKEYEFDTIIISQIGQEQQISTYLVNELGVELNKITSLDSVVLDLNSIARNTISKIKKGEDFEVGICTQKQLESEVYKKWISYFKQNPSRLHRKYWEFAFISEALSKRHLLQKGYKGLGFAVGEEPLASTFCSFNVEVLATDLNYEEAQKQGWTDTNEHAKELDQINIRNICDKEKFKNLCSFKSLDMNNIPDDLINFDFIWSACALEHLGSITKGENFIYDSLKCLKPGGIAVHTTEYNFSSNTDTIETGATVLFRKKDIERIVQKLQEMGHEVEKINYEGGDMPIDKYIDLPPYLEDNHIKLLLDKYVITSIGLIIRKKL
ncbi:glycosyltransferase family 2 protein [Arcobacter sp. F2176]|uniref:glycosyltransferase family 2 protein n=1 Tax=Arcobacter sp. F2176 TaxID=2044511 RepID=UPI00100BFD44|nr:glycosyltransferase family 2 protein [Arcobacter sp. F2176]RXJ81111.1 hypothetical protein CRU95_09340 [Arcobacter sp. F2176]